MIIKQKKKLHILSILSTFYACIFFHYVLILEKYTENDVLRLNEQGTIAAVVQNNQQTKEKEINE